ncbi:MAG: hypothetical protein CMG75_00090 [Candidatus Marinimicrobia bacterium]|nr:hypothetical protein [Candidatus Neomarinimicrobiota bacterium]|tara:strand:- start:132 stop:1367 length:1236 start_codon:yes stop_codon:yes gene_type:complete
MENLFLKLNFFWIKSMKNSYIIIFFLILCRLVAQTEKIESDIKFHNEELNKIRSEIAQFEKRINDSSNREKSEIERLNEIDEEISLVRNFIFRLRKEEKSKEKLISEAENIISEKELKHNNLLNRYAKRIVSTYKKGRLSDLEKLLDSKSWEQAVYRAKYLEIISNYDKSLSSEIKLNLNEINYQKKALQLELNEIKKIDKEKIARKKWLEQRRKIRTKQLDNLKKDRQQMIVAMEERKKAAGEMEKIITSLERERAVRIAELERKRKEIEMVDSKPFKELKGNLPWPIQGKVISQFGTFRNPNLKTLIENTGIDISANIGGDVKSIYDGIVTTITYIRGYGNTIIIDHGDGFYSVYTHVTDIEVEENSYVEALEIIAKVGDSGSLDGVKLHFEIWANREKVNPQLWLKKR